MVVPTIGRPSLATLLHALAGGTDFELIVVDDRRQHDTPLAVPPSLAPYTKVLTGSGAGPAAARNLGWQAATAPWVVFLDDDVRPEPDWWLRLAADLAVPADVGGVQGRLQVPLPADRRPTDWERSTHGLTTGWWITADMAYRTEALAAAGGFDERFPRAFREDAELAHRVTRAGWRLVRGRRRVVHPVRPEGPWVSLRVQRGNADDALLRRLYGPHWRKLLAVPQGRRRRHATTTAAGCLALACAAHPRLRPVAVLAGAGWLGLTAQFAAVRVQPGPRTAAEIATMVATSALIPPLATAYWLAGWARWRGARRKSPLRSGMPRVAGVA